MENPTEQLERVRRLASELNPKEARVGFFFRNDEGPLREGFASELYCVSVQPQVKVSTFAQAPTFTLVTMNRVVWEGGVLKTGGPNRFESRSRPGIFSKAPSADFKPEGQVRDLNKTDLKTPLAFNVNRRMDKAMLNMVEMLFKDDLTSSRGKTVASALEVPTVLCPMPVEGVSWITPRQGQSLDSLVELTVNMVRYNPFGLRGDYCAVCDGKVKPTQEGYMFSGGLDDDGSEFVREMTNPGPELGHLLRSVGGPAMKIQLYPLFKKEADVVGGQALWTPLREQAEKPDRRFSSDELKRHPAYRLLQYLAILSNTVEYGDGYYCDASVAYGDYTPLVVMPSDFPKVQRVVNEASSLAVVTPYVEVDVAHVPFMGHMKRRFIKAVKKHGRKAPAAQVAQ